MVRPPRRRDDAGPHRSEPRRHQDRQVRAPHRRPPPHGGRRREVLHEGRLHAAEGGQAALQPRADARVLPGARAHARSSRSATRSCPSRSCARSARTARQYAAMVNDACPAGFAPRPSGRRSPRHGIARGVTADPAPDRDAQRRHPLRLRDGRAGHRRRGDRRLGERQQVLAPGRPPRREPDGQLRGHDGPHARRRVHDLRLGPPRRHGPLAGRERVGHLRPAARVLPLLRGGDRRDEAHPVRPAGGARASSSPATSPSTRA